MRLVGPLKSDDSRVVSIDLISDPTSRPTDRRLQ
jgi:hypothetical protein